MSGVLRFHLHQRNGPYVHLGDLLDVLESEADAYASAGGNQAAAALRKFALEVATSLAHAKKPAVSVTCDW